MTTLALKNEIFGTEQFGYKSSLYVDYKGMTVRISDHLPQDHNIKNQNEEGSKVFFIFTDCDFSYEEAESYLEKKIGSFLNYDFVIYEEGDDIEMIKRLIERHS